MFNDLILPESRESRDVLHEALTAIREHLGMEVGYISEFVGNETVFRTVSAPGLEHLIKPGDRQSLDDVYCRHILEGRLPNLIPDTAAEPLAASMPITDAVPIGSHASLPVRRPDGSVYGMFCCLSPRPNATLNERDLKTMQVFVDLATRVIGGTLDAEAESRAVKARIDGVLAEKAFRMVYQPIVDLRSLRPAGYESLCRFDPAPYRTPDVWFGEAAACGQGPALEMAAIEAALGVVDELAPGQYVSLNASPETIVSRPFVKAMAKLPLDRLVLEITEHAAVADYDALCRALGALRGQGLRLAVDDAGAGHSSLTHIVRLRPDIVKLDMSLTRDLHLDLARRALVGALMFYSRETDAVIVAEGIETRAEFDALRDLGVAKGQGYFLGKPAPALASEEAIAAAVG